MNEKKSFFQRRIAELPYVTIFFLIVMCFNFYFIAPIMFSMINITNMAIQMTFILLLGMGQAVVMLSGNVDLSVGAIVGTSTMIMGVLIDREVSLEVAIIVALLFCLVVGGINGLLVAICKLLLPTTKSKFFTLVLLKLPAVVITYIMMRILIGLRGMSTLRMIPLGEGARLDRSTFLIISFFVFILLLALWAILEVTKMGKRIYALGNALSVKEFPRVSVTLNTVIVYMLSALFAGLAGLFVAFRVGGISPFFGTGVMEITILAAIIGGIFLRGGQGMFIGVFVGVLFEQILRTGLMILRFDFYAVRAITLTVMIILAVINTARSILIRRAREKVPQESVA